MQLIYTPKQVYIFLYKSKPSFMYTFFLLQTEVITLWIISREVIFDTLFHG